MEAAIMANESETLYFQEYNDLLKLLVQQKSVRFRHAMTSDTHRGKQASPVDQVGLTTVQQRSARFQPKINTDIPLDRRWVQPQSFSTHSLVDKFDLLRQRIKPNSAYMKAEVAAMSRKMDDEIIFRFFGAAQTGEEGGTSTSFPATQEVAVGTTDLTVAKLLAGQEILYNNDVDIVEEGGVFCGITPHQQTTLINSQEINNADFVETKIFDSKIGGLHGKTWFGITFILSTRLQADGAAKGVIAAAGASATRACPMWVESGMHLGIWDDIRGTILQRFDLDDDPWEMSTYSTHGATRIEEKKVVKIICKETP